MLELVRRVVLSLCAAVGMWLFFLVDQSPYFFLAAVPAPHTQETARSRDAQPAAPGGRPLIAAEDRRAPPMLQEVTVSGHAWADFLTTAGRVSLGMNQDPEWVRRVPKYQRSYANHPRDIYFRANEPPLRDLAQGLPRPLAKTMLALAVQSGGEQQRLTLQERIIRDDAFHLGSGVSEYGAPPSAMTFPWRDAACWVWGAGLALYLLLPRTRHRGEVIRYAAWLAPLGDFGGMLLFMTFFSLPLLIAGGSLQAVREWPGFPMFFWAMAGLGLLTLWFSAKTAAFWAEVQGDRLVVGGLEGQRAYPFADIVSAGNAVIKPPSWLIRLLWLAALSGKGTQRMMGVGQALIFGESQAAGVRLTLRDGTRVYLWLTNAMGTLALKGCETLADALEHSRIPKDRDVEELRLLFPPDAISPAGVRSNQWREWITALLIMFGPALLVLAISLAFPEKAWR